MHTPLRSLMSPRHLPWLGFGLVVLLSSCSSRTQPIRGVVQFADTNSPAKELAGYLVTFESADQQVSGTGVVKDDGTFEVSTFNKDDGAVLGKHRVALTPPVDEEGATKPWLILRRYGEFKTSGLEAEVKSGTNDVVLTVERAVRPR